MPKSDKMKKVLSDLSILLRSELMQNANLVIGNKLQELYNCILSGQKPTGSDFENILYSLITANKGKLGIIDSQLVGKIASYSFAANKSKDTSRLLAILTNEISKNSLQAIIIFGHIAKNHGLEIVDQIPPILAFMLKNEDEKHFPLLIQCYRRIIKGTGPALKEQCYEMFSFVLKCVTSNDISIQIESIKTLPAMLTEALLTYKRLMVTMEPYIQTSNKKLRYFIAKSIAKMMYANGCQTITDEYGIDVIDTKKMYKVAFNTILQYAQIYQNIPTMCHCMMMWIRNLTPQEITKRITLFAKFALAIVPFNLPMPYACTFSRTVFKAMTSVIGSIYEPLICHYVYELARKEGFTSGNTMITLDTLINFRASSKTLTKAAKTFYPLLATEDLDIVRMVSSFFIVVGRREQKASQILVDSFVSWLTSDDIKPVEIHGFARGTAALVMTANISEQTIKKITEICRKWLNENVESSDPRFASALLLCSAVFKRSPTSFPMQLTLIAFRALPRLFRAGEKLSDSNGYLAIPMKFGAILMKQVILSNIETLPSLYPTIQQCAITIAHNSGYLAAPTLLSLWLSIKNCKPAWHISLPQTMMNATPTILARFYDPKQNEIDYGMRKAMDDVDQSEILFGTGLPSQYITICTEKMETIYTLLVSDVRTPMRDELVKIVLRDYAAWAILSANPLKKSTLAQLYTPYQEQDNVLFQLRLTLIRAITTRPHIAQFIRPDAIRVLFGFNSNDIRTTRILGAAIAAYVNLQEDKFDALLEFIESPKVNGPLIAAVISELRFPPSRNLEAVRCMLALERLMVSDPHPLVLFSLIHLIELNLIPDEFVDQTVSIIEQVLYNDCMCEAENSCYLSQCINLFVKSNNKIRNAMAEAYFHMPFNKTLNMLLGLKLMTKPSKILQTYNFTIEKPRPLLQTHIKFFDSIQEVPLILEIIQQGKNVEGEEKMKELFHDNKDLNFWLLLAKQIIIKGSVPFIGNDTKISPSTNVIHATMTICNLILEELKMIFPEKKERIAEIIGFSIAVLNLRDFSIHECAFDILNNFIELFNSTSRADSSKLQNQDSQTIQMYHNIIDENEENLIKAYRFVFDKNHSFAAGITYSLTYYAYLHSKHSNFLQEATYLISQTAFDIQNLDPINFIRLAGRLMLIIGHPIKEIAVPFVNLTENFISDVCRQKVAVRSLKNEAHTTIITFMKLKKDFPLETCLTMALLREMELNDFNQSMLQLMILLVMRQDHNVKETVDFAISVVASSSYYNKEMNSDEIPANPEKLNTIHQFLAMIVSKIPPNASKWEDTFKNTLSLSLANNPSYKSLALLVRCASQSIINDIGPSVFSFIMRRDNEKSNALMELLFARMPIQIIDQIITSVIKCAVKPQIKFNAIKHALKYTRNTALDSLNDIAQLTVFFLYPDGAQFLGYILSNEKTVVYGLNILRLGVADYLLSHGIQQEFIKLELDLLIIATEKMNVLFPTEFWPKETSKLAINTLLKLKKNDKENISHICTLLKLIDPNVISNVLQEMRTELPHIFGILSVTE